MASAFSCGRDVNQTPWTVYQLTMSTPTRNIRTRRQNIVLFILANRPSSRAQECKNHKSFIKFLLSSSVLKPSVGFALLENLLFVCTHTLKLLLTVWLVDLGVLFFSRTPASIAHCALTGDASSARGNEMKWNVPSPHVEDGTRYGIILQFLNIYRLIKAI